MSRIVTKPSQSRWHALYTLRGSEYVVSLLITAVCMLLLRALRACIRCVSALISMCYSEAAIALAMPGRVSDMTSTSPNISDKGSSSKTEQKADLNLHHLLAACANRYQTRLTQPALLPYSRTYVPLRITAVANDWSSVVRINVGTPLELACQYCKCRTRGGSPSGSECLPS